MRILNPNVLSSHLLNKITPPLKPIQVLSTVSAQEIQQDHIQPTPRRRRDVKRLEEEQAFQRRNSLWVVWTMVLQLWAVHPIDGLSFRYRPWRVAWVDCEPRILERRMVETTWRRSLVEAGWRVLSRHRKADEVGRRVDRCRRRKKDQDGAIRRWPNGQIVMGDKFSSGLAAG